MPRRTAHRSPPRSAAPIALALALLVLAAPAAAQDFNVPFSESVDVVEALREQGVQFEQLVFPDEVHGFLLHEHWVEAFRATADFLDRTLDLPRSAP